MYTLQKQNFHFEKALIKTIIHFSKWLKFLLNWWNCFVVTTYNFLIISINFVLQFEKFKTINCRWKIFFIKMKILFLQCTFTLNSLNQPNLTNWDLSNWQINKSLFTVHACMSFYNYSHMCVYYSSCTHRQTVTVYIVSPPIGGLTIYTVTVMLMMFLPPWLYGSKLTTFW